VNSASVFSAFGREALVVDVGVAERASNIVGPLAVSPELPFHNIEDQYERCLYQCDKNTRKVL
jgi:hypothetical protein